MAHQNADSEKKTGKILKNSCDEQIYVLVDGFSFFVLIDRIFSLSIYFNNAFLCIWYDASLTRETLFLGVA